MLDKAVFYIAKNVCISSFEIVTVFVVANTILFVSHMRLCFSLVLTQNAHEHTLTTHSPLHNPTL